MIDVCFLRNAEAMEEVVNHHQDLRTKLKRAETGVQIEDLLGSSKYSR